MFSPSSDLFREQSFGSEDISSSTFLNHNHPRENVIGMEAGLEGADNELSSLESSHGRLPQLAELDYWEKKNSFADSGGYLPSTSPSTSSHVAQRASR